ncbi:hypothetical protein N7507_003326 [Penicillium longicatenatum]|nr:hypothetical protein N7507_003326 [Penicillium longicatenatum]
MTTNISMNGTNDGMQVAYNSGQINHYVSPPERAQTPPEPHSTVPFSRNPDFVDRGTLLEDIHEKCSAPDARIALVGMGGVGKSQLGIEYCYRTRVTSPETWVFWIHASNAARFEQGYREIAEQAKIPRCQDSDASLMRSVVNWLRNPKRKWILVLDNLDDNRFLYEPRYSEGGQGGAKLPPVEYLPHNANGSIMITTRKRGVALDLVDENHLIRIGPMTQSDAVSLLEIKLGDEGKEPNKMDVLKLAETLEYLPLAIIQAAAYIRRQIPLYLIKNYLEDFERSDGERLKLLAHESGRHHRDWEAKNSILVTWQLSFDQLRADNPSAADLLSLMSFFDRHAIPEALLHTQPTEYDQQNIDDTPTWTLAEETEWFEIRTPIRGRLRQALHDRLSWLRPSIWAAKLRSRDHQAPESAGRETAFKYIPPENTVKSRTNTLRDDILVLRDYSFVSFSSDPTLLEMHHLVQLATRKWLESHGEFEKWQERFIRQLNNAIPKELNREPDWAVCRLLLPHVESAQLQRPSSDALMVQWGILLHRTACYLSEAEVPGVLLPLSLDSFQVFQRCLLPENELIIWNTIDIALTYMSLGKYADAEEITRPIIENAESLERMECDHVSTAMMLLISIYKEQNRLQDAESEVFKYIELQKRISSSGSRKELLAKSHLVDIYLSQGRYQEAETLGLELVETAKLKDPEDFSTFVAIGALGSTYMYLGNLPKAEELFHEAVTDTKKIFGHDNRETIRYMNRLGNVYSLQGRLTEAYDLFKDLLPIAIRKFGVRHPESLSVMQSIGCMYWEDGGWLEGETIMRKILKARQEIFGMDNHKAFEPMEPLLNMLREKGQFLEAEEFATVFLDSSKKASGSGHPQTLRIMQSLASIWKARGKTTDAVDLLSECIKLRQQVFPKDHSDTRLAIDLLESWSSESVVPDVTYAGQDDISKCPVD